MTASETIHSATPSTSKPEVDTNPPQNEAVGKPLTEASFTAGRIDRPANVVEALTQAYATLIHTDTLQVQCDPGLDISEKIANNGMAQISFPLPNGETLGKTLGIGLPTRCTDPRLHSITRDSEGRGLWLKISGKNTNGELTTVQLLFTLEPNVTRKEALIEKKVAKAPDPTTLAMQESYATATDKGNYTFPESGLPISEKIANDGKAQSSFPLPNGETLGKPVSIGLPQPCSDPCLHSITRDSEERGLWLEISGKNTNGDLTTVQLLFTLKPNVTGTEALIEKTDPTTLAMQEGYASAKEQGTYTFPDPGLDISEKIDQYGKAQSSFPLPNGETLGKPLSIGLPKLCSDPRLISISHNTEENSYRLVIRALDKHDFPCEVEVTLSGEKNVREREAILSYTRDDSTALPEEFLQRSREGIQTAQRLTQRALQKKGGVKLVNSAKGDCFEQLAGVLLAGLYKDTQVLPQYCVHVDKSRGYYGLRVDFKVGEEFFEIKWGNATENIKETHRKHTAMVDGNHYTVLCLCNNEALGKHNISYRLFSQYIQEGHPLASELEATMERIARIEHSAQTETDRMRVAEYIRKLEIITGYLYSTFHRVSTDKTSMLFGDARINELRTSLTLLNELPQDDTLQTLINKTTRHRSPLEAYFELDGKTHRRKIPIKQLQEEEPDRYDLGYCFFGYAQTEDGERTLRPLATFTEKKDLALIWTLSCAHTAAGKSIEDPPNRFEVTGTLNEQGWFTKPSFTVTVGGDTFSFSSYDNHHPTSDLKDLKALAARHGLSISDEDIKAANELFAEHSADVHQKKKNG